MSHRHDDTVTIPGLMRQLDMLGNDTGIPLAASSDDRYFEAEVIDLEKYDRIVVCMSGGKDSLACLLQLIELDVVRSKIELWHHDVDGREGSTLMDWLFMADYNRQIAEAFNVPLYFSWLKHGFEGEMLKENGYSHPQCVETPEGLITLERDTRRSKPATRLRFPQVSASLQTRWCSSSLKIEVGRRALNNQERFLGKKTLFVTGERREESSNRARYFQLERHAMLAPVPYRLGWNRSSCMTCIFNGPRVWATIAEYFPERARQIADYENQFGTTISRDRINVLEIADRARPFEIEDLVALEQATRRDYTLPVLATHDHPWTMPAGAFGQEGCGAS